MRRKGKSGTGAARANHARDMRGEGNPKKKTPAHHSKEKQRHTGDQVRRVNTCRPPWAATEAPQRTSATARRNVAGTPAKCGSGLPSTAAHADPPAGSRSTVTLQAGIPPRLIHQTGMPPRFVQASRSADDTAGRPPVARAPSTPSFALAPRAAPWLPASPLPSGASHQRRPVSAAHCGTTRSGRMAPKKHNQTKMGCTRPSRPPPHGRIPARTCSARAHGTPPAHLPLLVPGPNDPQPYPRVPPACAAAPPGHQSHFRLLSPTPPLHTGHTARTSSQRAPQLRCMPWPHPRTMTRSPRLITSRQTVQTSPPSGRRLLLPELPPPALAGLLLLELPPLSRSVAAAEGSSSSSPSTLTGSDSTTSLEAPRGTAPPKASNSRSAS